LIACELIRWTWRPPRQSSSAKGRTLHSSKLCSFLPMITTPAWGLLAPYSSPEQPTTWWPRPAGWRASPTRWTQIPMSGCTRQGGFSMLPLSSRPRALLLGATLCHLSHPSQRPLPTGIALTSVPRWWPKVVVTPPAAALTTHGPRASSLGRSKDTSLPFGVPLHATGLAMIMTSVTPSRPGTSLTCSPTLLSGGAKVPPWITLTP
jgi:hypothetical protein